MAAANPTIELSIVLYFGGPKHGQWEVMQEPTPSVVRHLSPPTAPVYFTPFEEEQEEEEYPLISTETYHRGELIVDGHTQWVLRHSNVPYLSASDIAEIVRLTRANRMARAADAQAREILLAGDSYTTTLDNEPEFPFNLVRELNHSRGVVVPVANPIQAPSSIYNGASMMGTFPAMVTNPPLPTAAEPEPSGVLVPLRNPGEAPRLRKITLPK